MLVGMGRLGFGRLVSLKFDRFSLQFLTGLILKVLFVIWRIANLKNIDEKLIHYSRM